MTDIFISYSSKDRPLAETLAKAFEQERWSVWWDRELIPGEDLDPAIRAALKKASCVVILWTTDSVKSKWVKDEANLAEKWNTQVPVLIDGTEPPLGFGQSLFLKLDEWDGTTSSPAFRRLVDGLTQKIGHGPEPGPDPDPRRGGYCGLVSNSSEQYNGGKRVLTFRVGNPEATPRLIEVQMSGHSFEGSVKNGDKVHIDCKVQEGKLVKLNCVENLTSSTLVRSRTSRWRSYFDFMNRMNGG